MVLFFDLSEEENYIYAIIGEAAQELQSEAYMIGGYVRDKILGRKSYDMDIVSVGSGIALAKKVAEKLKPVPKVAVYQNYGTASLRNEHLILEFVGARKESYSPNSRKPAIENGTLYDDQLRRDFTINALAISLNPGSYGELIDPFDGMEHLSQRLIKTPLDPDKTFSDDPLRMMRAIRFANQLGFIIHPETLNAIKNNNARLQIVSPERIYIELDKIMRCDVPSIGFKLLYDTGLLNLILPELVELAGVEYQNGKGHKDNFYHTLQVLDNVAEKSNNIWLRWAALLHDIAKPATKKFDPKSGWTFHGHDILGAIMIPKIFKRLRMPLDNQMRYVQKLVRYHLRPISLTKENITDSAVRRLIVDAGEDIDDLMLLCEADITSKNQQKVRRLLDNYEMVRQKMAELEENDRLRNWQPPISGDTIMNAFDLQSGPLIGELKNEIREAVLEGTIENDFRAAYDFLLDLGKKKGLKIKVS